MSLGPRQQSRCEHELTAAWLGDTPGARRRRRPHPCTLHEGNPASPPAWEGGKSTQLPGCLWFAMMQWAESQNAAIIIRARGH